MNERIAQFAKQTLSKDQFGLWLAGDGDIEKFAELIVRECGKSCTLQGDEDDMFSKFGIKHFGVEE